jgi:hypothetical protein
MPTPGGARPRRAFSAKDLLRRRYQAWPAPQCGQITVVETFASNRRPHSQL